MDPRLEEAAHAGDVRGLHQLLEQDRLLLHRINTSPHPTDNPLHIAASLGHSEFAREVLEWNPELARAVNGQGLSPLHLASAHGHLSVVKELLSKVGSDLCLLSNRDGLLPIHTAAINGRIQVLEELMNASAESVHVRTSSGDNILHLAVKFNCFEAVRYLVERLEQEGDTEFLMSRDANGNTILHLATARRQLEVVKILLRKRWANVNATNSKGLTVLDVLLESPCQHGDLVLGEMIHAAGGKTSAKRDDDESHETSNDPPGSGPGWLKMLVLLLKYPLVSVGLGYLVGVEEPDYEAYYKKAPESLIVVATLIATITFQGGLSPPGGVATKGDEKEKRRNGDPYIAGTAVLAESLNTYIQFDMIALMTSLSVILLLVCLVPRKKGPIKFMMWMTWISVFFMGLAFDQAVFLIFPYTMDDFYFVWLVIVSFYTIMLCLRFIVYMLKGVGWLKDNNPVRAQHTDHLKGERLLVRRIGTCIAIVLAICAAGGVIFFVVRFGLLDESHDFTDLLH